MTASRVEALRALVVAAVIAGAPAIAFAQNVTAPPRVLGAPQPDDTAQQLDDATTVPAKPTVLGKDRVDAVMVAPLGSSEGAAVGTLDDSNGGLGAGIWSGTDRGTAESLLSEAPIANPQKMLRDLGRRLLLTKADAPVGAADHAFITARIRKLLEAGFIDEAGALAAEASLKDDEDFARAQADALLYANRSDLVCTDATSTRLSSSEPFWIELRAYCYAVAGDGDTLDLTRSVMDAQGLTDPAFNILLDDVRNQKKRDPGDITAPTSLHLFLLRQTGQKISPALAQQLGPAASLLSMRDAKNSADARLAAAENALATGAITPEELTMLASAQMFAADQLSHALDTASNMPFLAGQALLRQAAMRENDPSRKVQLVYQALLTGEQKGMLAIAATLQHAPAASIKPIPAMRPMADMFARALMLAGDADAAERWYAILDPKTDGAMVAKFQAELNLVAGNPARSADAQKALGYFAKQIPAPGAPALTAEQANAALVLGIYDTLKEPMPPEASAAAANIEGIEWPGRRPAPGLSHRLAAALVQPDRKGEALLSVLAIAGMNPGELAPDVTIRLVKALLREGLPDIARGFAIDALLLRPAPLS